MSTYPRYAASQLDGVKAGELLEWDEREGVYRAIAKFPHAVRASLVADDLNAQEERRRAEDKAAEEDAARDADDAVERFKNGSAAPVPAEPREVQLDALVIPGDVKAHPELHADHRPDSYGQIDRAAARELVEAGASATEAVYILGGKLPDPYGAELERAARQRKADEARLGRRPIGFGA